MSRTLIRNISAEAQTLPAIYGGFVVAVGHGRVVSDETSVAVNELGGFAGMDGKWNVFPVSTDTMLGDLDIEANGLSMLATFVPGGNGNSGPVDWADLTGKPSFATVATSGSYADLSDKPVLADVATTGSYADLSGTPTLPSASNATPASVAATAAAGVQAGFARADHQHAHGNLAGGSLHSTATSLSAGFMSAADKSKVDGLATVATSGDYADLTGKPTLFSGSYADLSGKPTLFSGSYADLTNKPGTATSTAAGFMSSTDKQALDSLFQDSLSQSGAFAIQSYSTVASTGDYNDLINKPNLSAYLTAVPDGSVTTAKVVDGAITNAKIASVAASKVTGLANVATTGAYADLSGKPSATYDIASFMDGGLSVGKVIAQVLAPKNLTLTALAQTGAATVKVQVAGADITYPKSVTSGQVISVVVTVAGASNTFTISAVEA